MAKTVMIVEDEERMRFLLSQYLKKEGYEVLEAENGVKALELYKKQKADLILLDVMMPGLDGFAVCKSLRETSSDTFIIMLTAKSEEYDKLMGYEFGADDYVTKPFSPKVLMAKVNAFLKRTQNDSKEGTYTFSGLTVSEPAHSVTADGVPLEFSPKEFDLLVYLIKNKNIVLSRETILNSVWGYDYFGDLRTVDTHIKRVRQKLGKYGNYVITVRGYGYKFNEEIS